MAGYHLQATPQTITLDSQKQVEHQCHASNRSQTVLGCSCSRQLLGCSPAQKVHLGLHHTWRRIWYRLNKNEILVVEGGILDKSHCQRSIAEACPSDGPEVTVVSLTMNT